MKLNKLAEIISRLIGIYLIFYAIAQLAMLMLQYLVQWRILNDSDFFSYLILSLIIPIGLGVIGFLLMVKSAWIASLIISDSEVETSLSSFKIHRSTVYLVAINVIVGLELISTLPDFITGLIGLFRHSIASVELVQSPALYFIQDAIRIALAILLFTYQRKIALWAEKKRRTYRGDQLDSDMVK